jgi:hypothetical protein
MPGHHLIGPSQKKINQIFLRRFFLACDETLEIIGVFLHGEEIFDFP